jgi:peptide chain release factor subunit 1
MTSPAILILTPMKSATRHLEAYFAGLAKLSYPHTALSLGVLEGDSDDDTFTEVQRRVDEDCKGFRRKTVTKKDFGFHLPAGVPRYAAVIQLQRRAILARARNHLLFQALRDEDWVLWLDVDVIDYPADILERLLAVGRDIVQPHCVTRYGGKTFDRNAWRDNGSKYLSDFRGQRIVRLDAVGGTMLLVRADRHRDGLVFPPFLYGARSRWIRDQHPLSQEAVGEIETEGFGIMAKDMGIECWGLPDLEILHVNK